MSANTAVILIDPYNDFLHPEGKITPMVAESLKELDSINHIHELVTAARKHRIPIFYGLHQQCNEYFIDGWKHATPSQQGQKKIKLFEEGSWGVEMYKGLEPDPKNGDVVISKHWAGSSFQNTDLDYQLRQRDITNVVICGMAGETCVDTTVRYAYELGYNVTVVKDSIAWFTPQVHKVHVEMIWPRIAHKILTAGEWVVSLKN